MGRNRKLARGLKKNRIRERYNQKVDELEIHEVTPKEAVRKAPGTIRKVAAYCRVSTQEEQQTSSFELQVKTYTDLINNTPDYQLVNIYADEGISGTNIEHRLGFQQMIKDCKAGKIDLIITKSISRFARNVKDTLATIQILDNLPHPVEVKFETEHIDTFDPGMRFLLMMMAGMAEQESRTKSDIMNWSFENRIKNGIFLTPPLYGYDQDENGDLVVNDKEAKVVQFIYYSFLTGFNCSQIANFLTSLHIKTYSGKDTWNSGTIRGIIRNERHCEDILAHKTYTPDFLTHKHKVNRGERTWVRKEDHHDPIVSRTVWTAANRKMEVEFRNRKGETLPSLSVVDQGILKGYVPVDRNIRGFSEADYEEASRSVLTDDLDDQIEKKHQMDSALDGYEVVRSFLFNTMDKPIMTFSNGQIYFNTNCVRELNRTEYVELLLNTKEKCIAVRPCEKITSTAVRWVKFAGSMIKPMAKSCRGLVEPLCNLMDWDPDAKYRFVGRFVSSGDECCLFFDLADPEITQDVTYKEEDTENSENDIPRVIRSREDEIEQQSTIRHKKVVFYSDDGFGRDAAEELEPMYFKGDWQILRPATFFKYCSNITKGELKEIIEEAQSMAVQMKTNVG